MTNKGLSETLNSLSVAGDVKHLVLATKEQLGDFTPRPNDCHGNADGWVELHPEHHAIHGFLVISDYMFNKHSVVDTGSELLDITPRPPNESRNLFAFIVFDGGSRAIFDGWPNQVVCTP